MAKITTVSDNYEINQMHGLVFAQFIYEWQFYTLQDNYEINQMHGLVFAQFIYEWQFYTLQIGK
ncbi:hypothetical protein HUG17_2022 [Dermatophagoides farinae]|uniref:Uncharacterized protein n=1 Tax=Dermatophagoides farinae TaxID=6954 RepID=A0A9D4P938_DERFA|nr:hypothetical protein HUG17_2022 [Dermatophagoides farinae]